MSEPAVVFAWCVDCDERHAVDYDCWARRGGKRCSLCDCAIGENGLCVDALCPGSREDDDDYYRRMARSA